MRFRFAACILPLLCLCTAMPLLAQRQLCIAYSYNSEIKAKCGDKITTVLAVPGLFDFAIADLTIVAQFMDADKEQAMLIQGGQRREIPPYVKVYTTCGTIYGEKSLIASVPPWFENWDILANKPAHVDKLMGPVCSDNRSVIVGITSDGSLATSAGKVIVHASSVHDIVDWGISPSGEFVGYLRTGYPGGSQNSFCVANIDKSTKLCSKAGDDAGASDRVSVDDMGNALFVQSSAAPGRCFYSGGRSQIVTRERLRHSQESECFGVWLASATSPPKELIPLGLNPAWISAGEVDRLMAAAAHRPKGKR